jgi:hypothetical protein
MYRFDATISMDVDARIVNLPQRDVGHVLAAPWCGLAADPDDVAFGA